MRKRFLFIFALIFSINTLSLSALAAPCPHMEKVSYQKTDMPDCHKKASDPQKSGHCKGICFCIHAQLSHNILPFTHDTFKAVFEKDAHALARHSNFSDRAVTPDLRPPISFS